ncbi:hypothetical protein CYY_010147 [Polysphondylium violaceum]|uniref:Reverse transcriptase domain-containing protein n=1 Tax=Polysphondylium violaceum TaxID=133409 RepID=A0A8J4PJZ3_9MYCE|nr:hypothetical protein CYY_010147 [Polysphondylium violaceum]
MDMIKGSTIKLQVNGKLTKPFPVETGIKQGDPISPTLFVIVVESLASAINSDQELKGIPLSLNNPNLKNFLKSYILLMKDTLVSIFAIKLSLHKCRSKTT